LKVRERFAHWRSKLRHYKEKIISLLEVPGLRNFAAI
jgi:hypothetical protein